MVASYTGKTYVLPLIVYALVLLNSGLVLITNKALGQHIMLYHSHDHAFIQDFT